MTRELYIVDDNPDYHFLLYKTLKQLTNPYAVKFFEDGRVLYRHLETLKNQGIQEHFPALILLDLNMPGMNGLQLLKLIKQPLKNTDAVFNSIPVVMMSSETSEDKINQCYQAGANAFVIKPVEFERMKSTLKSICEFWLR